MEFVNSIAHIVHTSVSLHGGSPNKNIGDAFLLVWKFPRGFKMRDISNVTRDRWEGPAVGARWTRAAYQTRGVKARGMHAWYVAQPDSPRQITARTCTLVLSSPPLALQCVVYGSTFFETCV